MKLITGVFIMLLLATVTLILGFKHISASTNARITAKNHVFIKRPSSLKIIDIPLPQGYTRVAVQPGSFAEWLENINLRKNNTVYLYNGQPIEQQELHYVVLDISTGNKDLQQCADAIMRLRAEYYFSRKEYEKINFTSGASTYNFNSFAGRQQCFSHDCLLQFMEKVFINCGTYTVDEMTKPATLANVQAGDVFVKAGAPGHAMIVVDVAQNAAGNRIYLLAQGFMPAQDMHIVINPTSSTLSPWFAATTNTNIITPGWTFAPGQFKQWK